MRRSLIVLVLLAAGCARAANPSGTGTVLPDCDPASPVSKASSPPNCAPVSTTEPGSVVDLEITCQVFYREGVEEQLDQGETLTLVANGDEAIVRRDHLTLRARYFDDEFEGRSLVIDISEGDRQVMRELYQLRRDAAPANDFEGGHGFTGLVYTYAEGGAEMQYFCTAHALRDQ